jgi:transposase-like protein
MSKLKSLEELFAGRHFGREVIILCVRWYLRYKISLRDLVEMIAERGLQLAPTTILCWVRRHAQSSSNAGTVSVEARTKIHLVTGMSIKT